MEEEFVVTPWEVRGRVDYEKLLKQFGARPLTRGEIEILEKYVGEVHPLIRRGFFYAHRDFDFILKWHGEGGLGLYIQDAAPVAQCTSAI